MVVGGAAVMTGQAVERGENLRRIVSRFPLVSSSSLLLPPNQRHITHYHFTILPEKIDPLVVGRSSSGPQRSRIAELSRGVARCSLEWGAEYSYTDSFGPVSRGRWFTAGAVMVCDDNMTSTCKDTENQKQGGEMKPLLEDVMTATSLAAIVARTS